MSNEDTRVFSRRAILKVSLSAGMGGALLATQALGAAPALAAPLSPRTGASTPEIENYLAATSEEGLTDLAGIREEYASAVRIFPLDVPEGSALPSTSRLRDTKANALWEEGNGTAEVYLSWQSTVVSSAQAAQAAGDAARSRELLDSLESAYASPLRKSVLEDRSGYYAAAISDARRGNFENLAALTAVA